MIPKPIISSYTDTDKFSAKVDTESEISSNTDTETEFLFRIITQNRRSHYIHSSRRFFRASISVTVLHRLKA